MISTPSKRVPGSASAVGWNWQNSRSARSAPAAAASTGPAPIAPRGLVVRRQSAAAPPVASTVAAAAIGPPSVITPWQRSPSLHSASRRGPLRHLDPRLGGDHRRQLRGDLVAGLAAAGVDDAAAGVAALEPERELALVVEVEDDAAGAAARGPRAGASSTRARTAAGRQRPRPAAIVSAAWRSGESSGSSAAASPPWAQKLALCESGVRETRQTLAAALGRPQRGPEAGGAAADDGDVELARLRLSPPRLSADRVELLAQPGGRAFAGARPLVGDRAARPRRRAARRPRPAARPPRPGPRSRPAAPRPRRSPRSFASRSLLQLLLVGRAQLLERLARRRARSLLEVGLQRLDLGRRPLLARPRRPSRGLPQPRARPPRPARSRLSSPLGPACSVAHRVSIYYALGRARAR